jgi:hypothetical protein
VPSGALRQGCDRRIPRAWPIGTQLRHVGLNGPRAQRRDAVPLRTFGRLGEGETGQRFAELGGRQPNRSRTARQSARATLWMGLSSPHTSRKAPNSAWHSTRLLNLIRGVVSVSKHSISSASVIPPAVWLSCATGCTAAPIEQGNDWLGRDAGQPIQAAEGSFGQSPARQAMDGESHLPIARLPAALDPANQRAGVLAIQLRSASDRLRRTPPHPLRLRCAPRGPG